MGRHSTYTKKVGNKVCEYIATSSMGVREIASQDGIPNDSTIFKWLRDNDKFSQQYARAKKDQMDFMAEEILNIADDAENDYMMRNGHDDDKDTGWVTNGEAIQRSKLRIEARKWLMGKLNAKKYGDKTQLTGADGEGPVEIVEIKRTIVDPKE